MAQVFGLVSVIWNGVKIKVEKGSTFESGGLQSKPVVSDQQVDYANEFVAGKASCTTVLQRGSTLSSIWIGQAAELQLQCDTGQTYVDPSAVLTNRMNWTAGEGGKVKLEWAIGAVGEITNG